MKAEIISNSHVARGYFDMKFAAAFDGAEPGQFVMIRVTGSMDPLLRRPMSVAGFENGICRVIYKVVGRGTQLLSAKNPGDSIDVLGPFGNAFSPPDTAENILLVGGGIGIAPLLYWHLRNPGRKATAFIGGAASNDILCADEFKHSTIATMDGSAGVRGLVTSPLLETGLLREKGTYLLACGPKGMLKAVDGICIQHGVSGELSLEERMGCGFGVCLGCVVDTSGGRKRMCVDGPVFGVGSVKWQT